MMMIIIIFLFLKEMKIVIQCIIKAKVLMVIQQLLIEIIIMFYMIFMNKINLFIF